MQDFLSLSDFVPEKNVYIPAFDTANAGGRIYESQHSLSSDFVPWKCIYSNIWYCECWETVYNYRPVYMRVKILYHWVGFILRETLIPAFDTTNVGVLLWLLYICFNLWIYWVVYVQSESTCFTVNVCVNVYWCSHTKHGVCCTATYLP